MYLHNFDITIYWLLNLFLTIPFKNYFNLISNFSILYLFLINYFSSNSFYLVIVVSDMKLCYFLFRFFFFSTYQFLKNFLMAKRLPRFLFRFVKLKLIIEGKFFFLSILIQTSTINNSKTFFEFVKFFINYNIIFFSST